LSLQYILPLIQTHCSSLNFVEFRLVIP